MSTLYTEIIQEAGKYPQHRGRLEDATFSADAENPLCGDMLHVDLRVEDDRVVAAVFEGRGCLLSQASAELMLDRLEGERLTEVAAWDRTTVLEELGIPSITPARLRCALLVLETLRRAVPAAAE